MTENNPSSLHADRKDNGTWRCHNSRGIDFRIWGPSSRRKACEAQQCSRVKNVDVRRVT